MDPKPTLQRLLDREAITALIHAYCYHFDRNGPDALVALFGSDAVVDYGPETPDLHGRTAIGAAVATGLKNTFAATSHHVSNISIRFDRPDAATSICHRSAWHRYHSGGPDGELWAQCHHAFRSDAEEWRIARLAQKAAGTSDFHRATMHPIGRRPSGDQLDPAP